MTQSYSDKAIAIIERQLTVAARDRNVATNRGIRFTPKGYVLNADNRRISLDAAISALAAILESEDARIQKAAKTHKTAGAGQPRRTDFNWDNLNQATKDFFYIICETMQTVSGDASMVIPVPVQLCRIGLANAPRLSNLKKAGLIETVTGSKKSQKCLVLTPAGRALFKQVS